MTFKLTAAAMAAALATVAPAAADTITQSLGFVGDLCLTDTDPESGNFDDCRTIPGNVGLTGVYEFLLTGLDAAPSGDVVIDITASSADLYEGPSENNPQERFRLYLDDTNFGLLFDGSEGDEAQVNPALAASVQTSIAAVTESSAPMALQIVLSPAAAAPLLADGEIAVQLDFREDRNINQFSDPAVRISYDTEGPGADAQIAALVDEIARLRAAVEAQNLALSALRQTVEELANQ